MAEKPVSTLQRIAELEQQLADAQREREEARKVLLELVQSGGCHGWDRARELTARQPQAEPAK